MKCYHHAEKDAVAYCANCGVGMCSDCVDASQYRIDGKPLCGNCNASVHEGKYLEIKKTKRKLKIKAAIQGVFLFLGILYAIWFYIETGKISDAVFGLMFFWLFSGFSRLIRIGDVKIETKNPSMFEVAMWIKFPGTTLAGKVIGYIIYYVISVIFLPFAFALTIYLLVKAGQAVKLFEETQESVNES